MIETLFKVEVLVTLLVTFWVIYANISFLLILLGLTLQSSMINDH